MDRLDVAVEITESPATLRLVARRWLLLVFVIKVS